MRAVGVRPLDQIASLGPNRRYEPTLDHMGLYRATTVSPLVPIDEQARHLAEIQPDVLWVYPTALRSLLQHVGTLSAIIRPRIIISSAEPLDVVLRKNLLDDRPYDIRNFYGSMEMGRIAWECGAHEGLHINSDACILQLEDDTELTGGGQSVVVTNLNVFASPYIRYRLGDRCKLLALPCSCGSSLPLIGPPTGRDWDVIQLPSGNLISPWGYNAILREANGLQQFRLIQEQVDLLVVQLKFDPKPSEAMLARLHDKLLRNTGEPLTLRIELVDHFENDALKFRAFISNLIRR